MPLAPGARVGAYEVTAKIGQGGMGEVWRARDANLGRDVAIKVLPDAFAHDAERLARSEREAKTLASLNHPNITAIYWLERADGVRSLVMELVWNGGVSIGPRPVSVNDGRRQSDRGRRQAGSPELGRRRRSHVRVPRRGWTTNRRLRIEGRQDERPEEVSRSAPRVLTLRTCP